MCTDPSSRFCGQQPPSDTWWERAPLPSSSSTPPTTSSVRFWASEPAQPPRPGSRRALALPSLTQRHPRADKALSRRLDLALQWSANCAADRSPRSPGSPFSLHGPLTGTPHCLRGTESVNSAAALSIFLDLPCLWQASQGHLWVCFGSWFELLRGAAAQESVPGMSGCSGENTGHATVRDLRLLSRGGGTQAPRCGSGVRPLLHGAGELVVLGVVEDGLAVQLKSSQWFQRGPGCKHTAALEASSTKAWTLQPWVFPVQRIPTPSCLSSYRVRTAYTTFQKPRGNKTQLCLYGWSLPYTLWCLLFGSNF